MNKIRYVQERKPPEFASCQNVQDVLDAMLHRSWAGVAKQPIVKKEAPANAVSQLEKR